MVSLLGTGITRFALLIWIFDKTHEATAVALLGFFSFGAYVLTSPLAGVWVDRLDRRFVMLMADFGAGIMTGALLVLYSTDNLQIWHVFVAQAFAGFFEAFQHPAYSATTTVLVPKNQYTRVSGIRSLGESTSVVLTPVIAGLMLVWIGIAGVMLVDLITFAVAIATLFVVRVPRPAPKKDDEVMIKHSMWEDFRGGISYIHKRPGLMGLLMVFTGINLLAALTYYSVLPALILARSGGSELALASVQSALGLGGVIGGLVLSAWGGMRRRIDSVLLGSALSFLLSDILFAVGQNVNLWVTAGFLGSFFVPFITAANRSIWQSKVPPIMQGRVFGLQNTFQQSAMPIGYLLAGPLADHLFEPLMAGNGYAVDLFGRIVGTGPGSGIALMFGCAGILGPVLCVCCYLVRPVRYVEKELPDFDEQSN